MATNTIIPSATVNIPLVINQNNNLQLPIPNIIENNILSYNSITFLNITEIYFSDNTLVSPNQVDSGYITINSFGFDTLPLNITPIVNKSTSDYSLKI